jgi:uncharacterized membrane protein YqhA
MAIIGISSIHLLRTFIEAGSLEHDRLGLNRLGIPKSVWI